MLVALRGTTKSITHRKPLRRLIKSSTMFISKIIVALCGSKKVGRITQIVATNKLVLDYATNLRRCI